MKLRYWKITAYPEEERKKIGRNDPCPCGSNIKYKKCCLGKRKPRSMSVVLDLGKPTEVNEVILDRDGNRFRLFSKNEEVIPKSASFETNYERIKSEKVINRSLLPPENIYIDPNRQFTLYNKIFAVDTNTRVIRNDVISVTAVVLCEVVKGLTFHGVVGRYQTVHWIEFRNPQYNPEMTGLRLLIKGIMANPKYYSGMKICLITDCDLDNIGNYNNRILPLVENFYLPTSFNLVYGSADVGKKDYLPNIFMSFADKASDDLLKDIEKYDEYGRVSQIPSEQASYTYYRLWTHKDYLK